MIEQVRRLDDGSLAIISTGGGMMSEELKWWGYLHSNGTSQLKRWFGDVKDYTDDCKGNPFVVFVVPPFEAATRHEAHVILAEKLRQR